MRCSFCLASQCCACGGAFCSRCGQRFGLGWPARAAPPAAPAKRTALPFLPVEIWRIIIDYIVWYARFVNLEAVVLACNQGVNGKGGIGAALLGIHLAFVRTDFTRPPRGENELQRKCEIEDYARYFGVIAVTAFRPIYEDLEENHRRCICFGTTNKSETQKACSKANIMVAAQSAFNTLWPPGRTRGEGGAISLEAINALYGFAFECPWWRCRRQALAIVARHGSRSAAQPYIVAYLRSASLGAFEAAIKQRLAPESAASFAEGVGEIAAKETFTHLYYKWGRLSLHRNWTDNFEIVGLCAQYNSALIYSGPKGRTPGHYPHMQAQPWSAFYYHFREIHRGAARVFDIVRCDRTAADAKALSIA